MRDDFFAIKNPVLVPYRTGTGTESPINRTIYHSTSTSTSCTGTVAAKKKEMDHKSKTDKSMK